jgi:hypothetical protein
MNSFNEYDCLKKIYKRLMVMASILPFILIIGVSLLHLLFIPLAIIMIFVNIYIYAKYYKKDDMGLFNENIGSLLKKTMISFLIITISLLPLAYTLMIIGSGGYYSMMMIGIISLFVGMTISWVYYLYNLIKLYKNLDQSLFYLDDVDNTVKLDQFEVLKNISSKYIVLTLIAPFIMYYSLPLLIVYVVSANLYMFLKYYNKTEDNLIHDNFKKIFKVTIFASIVVAISFTFKIVETLDYYEKLAASIQNHSKTIELSHNHDKDSLIFMIKEKASIYALYLGFLMGWLSALYISIKNFKINSNRKKLTESTLLNTDNKGDTDV